MINDSGSSNCWITNLFTIVHSGLKLPPSQRTRPGSFNTVAQLARRAPASPGSTGTTAGKLLQNCSRIYWSTQHSRDIVVSGAGTGRHPFLSEISPDCIRHCIWSQPLNQPNTENARLSSVHRNCIQLSPAEPGATAQLRM